MLVWFHFFVFHMYCLFFFFFKQKTAYEMRISDWSSDVCSSDLLLVADGAWPEGAETFERVFFLFDETSIAGARAEWRRLGQPKRYWKQDERSRWVEGPWAERGRLPLSATAARDAKL